MFRTQWIPAAAMAALGAIAGAAQAAPTGTLKMTSDANFSSQFPEGNAGEFQITALTGDTAELATMDAARRAGGAFFQTFCGQFAEDIFSNASYVWTLDTNFNGNPADPLLNTTAYLFQRFWDGTLPSYDFTLGAPRAASAKSLQLALWYLQGQIQANPTFLARYDADAQAKAWVALAQGSAPAGIGNVRVLVMQDNGIVRQDLLAVVPPPKEECCGYKELTFKYVGPDCVRICAIDPTHTGGYYRTSLPSWSSVRSCTTFTVYAGDCWTSGKFEDDVKLVVKNRCGTVIECTTVNTDCEPGLVVGTVYGNFVLTGVKEACCKPVTTKPDCSTKSWTWSRDCDRDGGKGEWCGSRDRCDRGELKDCADWTSLRDCKDFTDGDGSRSSRWFGGSSWNLSGWCRR